MNDNWEKKGFKYLEKIFGEGLSLEVLEKNLEKITNKELISFLRFSKNFWHILKLLYHMNIASLNLS